MKVTFTQNNGKQRVMEERFARTLTRLGRGSYLTRDMQASEVVVIDVAEPAQLALEKPNSAPEIEIEQAAESETPKRRGRKAKSKSTAE